MSVQRSDEATADVPENTIVVHEDRAASSERRRSASKPLPRRFAVEGVAVVDGDTLVIREGEALYLATLVGVEAPEPAQPFGAEARQRLAELVVGQRFDAMPDKGSGCVVPVRIDLGNRGDLAEVLLREGLAWVVQGAPSGWWRLEARARVDEVGLWGAPDSEAPWEYRRRTRGREP